MSGTTEIRAALLSRLTAAAPGCAIPAAAIAWENKKYVPGTARYYRATFIPGETFAAAVGGEAQNRHRGLLQIDVMEPPNTGDVAATAEAERIVACFKRGTTLTNGGVIVQVESAYRTRGDGSDPAWYMVPVLIRWTADVNN